MFKPCDGDSKFSWVSRKGIKKVTEGRKNEGNFLEKAILDLELGEWGQATESSAVGTIRPLNWGGKQGNHQTTETIVNNSIKRLGEF